MRHAGLHAPVGRGGSLLLASRTGRDGRALDPPSPTRRTTRAADANQFVRLTCRTERARSRTSRYRTACKRIRYRPTSLPARRLHRTTSRSKTTSSLAAVPPRDRRPRYSSRSGRRSNARASEISRIRPTTSRRDRTRRARRLQRRRHDVYALAVLGPHVDRLPHQRGLRSAQRGARSPRRRGLRRDDRREAVCDRAAGEQPVLARAVHRRRHRVPTPVTSRRDICRTAGAWVRAGGSTTVCAPTCSDRVARVRERLRAAEPAREAHALVRRRRPACTCTTDGSSRRSRWRT